jgi:group I intron endonuclease
MIIYKVTNKINNKVYIGQTIRSLKKRIYQHYYKYELNSDTHFHRALRYYPKEVFEWIVIYKAHSIQELNEKEEYFIKLFDSTNSDKGYNISLGGNNRSVAESTKEKLKILSTGRHCISINGKNNIRKSATNRIYTEKMRQNMSQSHQGNKNAEKYNYTLIDVNGIKYENINHIGLFCKNHNINYNGLLNSFLHNTKKYNYYKNWKVSRIKRLDK